MDEPTSALVSWPFLFFLPLRNTDCFFRHGSPSFSLRLGLNFCTRRILLSKGVWLPR